MLALLSTYGILLAIATAIVRRRENWTGWTMVLLSGYALYAWIDPAGFVWLIGVTLVCYAAARLQHHSSPSVSRWAFVIGILAVVVPLLGMKMWSLARGSSLGSVIPGLAGTLLPLGTSFYSLQALSYLIDVRRGTAPVEMNFGRFALYLGFFLQLFAGPVERARATIVQFAKRPVIVPGAVLLAIELILWGLFKKLVLADRIAYLLNDFWQHAPASGGALITLYALLSYIRIYADYSAYMNIVSGGALLLGIRLSPSFLQPYLARTVREFWHRWNITVSTWFRDYVYIPLGGSRKGTMRWILAILVTFLLSGVWHGSGWQFLLWGALHGVWLVLEAGVTASFRRACHVPLPKLLRGLFSAIGWVCTTAFVSVTFLLFQAPNLGKAFTLLERARFLQWHQLLAIFPLRTFDLGIIAAAAVLVLIVDTRNDPRSDTLPAGQPLFLRMFWIGCCLLLILHLGLFAESPFIYFRF
ncbi:TPA: hypothetical protein DCL30_00005 [Candidatus Peribacteria bacterium]|nr:MAG: hypothetical protein A2529_03080 [Candidatus Peribacteria bacterium RIFOXYD2_FULL_58_15]HAI97914.1 hypothetical protein [Candidatus Peribacteria bacterium]HAS34721.1 hypothetical protein [Candidatus Peribacteria bacterium]